MGAIKRGPNPKTLRLDPPPVESLKLHEKEHTELFI